MKQLQIDLKKRLLIVEASMFDDYEFINKDSKYLRVGNEEIKLNIPTLSKIELICKVDELTEEISKGLVDVGSYANTFKNYITNDSHKSNQKQTALESFISAIESNGWHWKNPLGEEPKKKDYVFEFKDIKEYNGMAYLVDHGEWKEAQSRTFNPETSIIFEIL